MFNVVACLNIFLLFFFFFFFYTRNTLQCDFKDRNRRHSSSSSLFMLKERITITTIYRNKCKNCTNLNNKKWVEKNPEKKKISNKKWVEKNNP